MPDVGIKIITAVLVFIMLYTLQPLARVLPDILACITRWKESVNIQMSSARHSRDLAALGLLPAFIFICANFHLYPKTAGMNFYGSLVITLEILAAYCLIRILCAFVFRSKKMDRENYFLARSSFFNFYIIAVILMSLTVILCSLLGINDSLTEILLWELAAVYVIFIIRKTQIFKYYGGFFSGILYLCTLEILPTSLLVASVWLL